MSLTASQPPPLSAVDFPEIRLMTLGLGTVREQLYAVLGRRGCELLGGLLPGQPPNRSPRPSALVSERKVQTVACSLVPFPVMLLLDELYLMRPWGSVSHFKKKFCSALPEPPVPLGPGRLLQARLAATETRLWLVTCRPHPVSGPKPQPPEGAKSNPSKRHRDRLNQELSKLTHLLPFPEDVRARLDKLSILRLIVGYLKMKGYFSGKCCWHAGCSANPPVNPGGSEHASPQINAELFSEGDLLLQALNGFLMAVTEDGYVFYVSPTVQDYLGFHQSDVIYQSVFELIHKEDRPMFQSQLRWSPDPEPVSKEAKEDTSPLPGKKFQPLSGAAIDGHQHPSLEDPPCLERSFVCRFRCLLDNSPGFLELHFHGHLKCLPGQNNRSEDGTLVSSQLTLFAIATPHQPLTMLELQTKTFLFQTKHKLDFTPIACDSRGKVALGYTESELCRRGSGYQFIHPADMMHCAEKHLQLIRTGESGLTVFRLLTKQASWLWVQSDARLVFRGGQPDCIVARQRVLTNAEGEEHLRKRALELPFTFTTGEAILYEKSLPGLLTTLPARKRSRSRKGHPTDQEGPVHPGSLLRATRQQDESMCLSCIAPTPQGSSLDRWGPDDRCEDEEEEEGEEGRSLLALIETLLEKDTGEPPDLCFTLRHLGVADLEKHPWEENLLGAESDPAGPQNCHLLPRSQGGEPQREEGALFPEGLHVSLSLTASTTPPPILRPRSSLSSGHLAMEMTPPRKLGTEPSPSQAYLQHFLVSGQTTPGPTCQSPPQNPPQQQPGHSQLAPLTFGMSQKQTISDHRSVASPPPEASSPRRPAQMFELSYAATLSLGENVFGHLAHPASGVLDFCEESVPGTPTHSGQCQEPLMTSDPTLRAISCGSHLSGGIWDTPIQGQPVMVPMEVGQLETFLPTWAGASPYGCGEQQGHQRKHLGVKSIHPVL
ncbi:aryl hydrocarbon receptor-like [Loxodonta africana]|uniref:aryl hydrocarbon receptor-like n=1 Tax=Loxodonta africana TaxID=9785 RepID=UPI0030D5C759